MPVAAIVPGVIIRPTCPKTRSFAPSPSMTVRSLPITTWISAATRCTRRLFAWSTSWCGRRTEDDAQDYVGRIAKLLKRRWHAAAPTFAGGESSVPQVLGPASCVIEESQGPLPLPSACEVARGVPCL